MSGVSLGDFDIKVISAHTIVMMTIATATGRTTAAPETLFAIWADMESWPTWNTDTEWVKLDGPCRQGAVGTLKPKGGPKVPFFVEKWVPGSAFVDVSKLFGARLTFDHQVRVVEEGTDITVTVTMSGPLRWLWKLILGPSLAASVQPDLENLVTVAEKSL
ncbi:MAG: SRPBCC family protein [Mycobacteriaceae bacterium]